MKFFRLSHASLCAIAASLLLAACGGDGDSSPTPPPSPAPGAAALPDVPNGRATLLAGSLEADPAKACGRVDADDPLQSRFGYITRDNTDYIFSQGALTQNMPSTGIARYDGEAIVGRNGQTDAADAKFIVGFGSRSLSGRIIPLRDSKVAFNEVNFNASIDGNSFYNNGLSVGTNGNFYGDNARELGGVFYDNNQELRGSFGATRR